MKYYSDRARMSILLSVSRQGIVQIPQATPAHFNKFERIYEIFNADIEGLSVNKEALIWRINYKKSPYLKDAVGKSIVWNNFDNKISRIVLFKIDSQHRGSGLGSYWLKIIENTLRSRESKQILVDILANNRTGLRFMQKHGYELGLDLKTFGPDYEGYIPVAKQL